MKIRLIKNDSVNEVGEHLSGVAWVNSRSHDDKTPLIDILKIDAPINDFPSFVINIESSIMVREIITSMNDHVMWARGSRVDDVISFDAENVKYPFAYKEDLEVLRGNMLRARNNGVRQDEYRLFTPVVAMTSYTIRVSLRSLIKLHNYFDKLQMELSGASRQIFAQATDEFHAFLMNVALEPINALEVDSIIESYRTVDLVPALDIKNINEGGWVGDFIVITVSIPFSLRTHLIRHNSLHIKDNLIEFFDDENIHKKTIGDEMTVQVCASTDFWKSVLRSRSCWMSHYGIWKPIMDQLNIFPQDESFLPCEGNGSACPFIGDAMLRLEGNDPNPPCPIFTNDNGHSASDMQKSEMENMFIQDKRPNFWNNIIANVKTQEKD